jgi:catechol 2,3-dioxygenase-like lactoylglutathione lyase family enzyme
MSFEKSKIDHVNVTVPKSVETVAKHFYGTILGLPEVEKPEESKGRGGAWYQIGPVQLHLSIEDGLDEKCISRRHVCFVVENLALAQEQLRQAGVEIVPDDNPTRGWPRFYARDPGGNRLEIAQDLR